MAVATGTERTSGGWIGLEYRMNHRENESLLEYMERTRIDKILGEEEETIREERIVEYWKKAKFKTNETYIEYANRMGWTPLFVDRDKEEPR